MTTKQQLPKIGEIYQNLLYTSCALNIVLNVIDDVIITKFIFSTSSQDQQLVGNIESFDIEIFNESFEKFEAFDEKELEANINDINDDIAKLMRAVDDNNQPVIHEYKDCYMYKCSACNEIDDFVTQHDGTPYQIIKRVVFHTNKTLSNMIGLLEEIKLDLHREFSETMEDINNEEHFKERNAIHKALDDIEIGNVN